MRSKLTEQQKHKNNSEHLLTTGFCKTGTGYRVVTLCGWKGKPQAWHKVLAVAYRCAHCHLYYQHDSWAVCLQTRNLTHINLRDHGNKSVIFCIITRQYSYLLLGRNMGNLDLIFLGPRLFCKQDIALQSNMPTPLIAFGHGPVLLCCPL